MRFMALCSSGLGSSFMVELNIKKALAGLGVTDAEVSHSDLGGATPADADVFIVGCDLADAAGGFSPLIVLDSLIDQQELETKLREVCTQKGLI